MVRDSLPQSPQLHVTVTPAEQRVARGDEAVFLVTIENRSREAQAQALTIAGLPYTWYQLDFDERRRVFPNEQRSASIVVRVPDSAEPGEYAFQAVVAAGGVETGVACTLAVQGGQAPSVTQPVSPPPVEEPVPAPGVTLNPAEVTWRGSPDKVTVRVSVRNVGSRDTDYNISLQGLQNGWFTLPQKLKVPARQAAEVDLTLQAPARARQDGYAFRVIAAVEAHPHVRGEAAGKLTIAAPEQGTQQTQRVVSPLTVTPTPPTPPPSTPVLPPEIALGPRTTFRFGQGEVAAQATLTVQNRSRLIERYQITVEGIPDDWFGLTMTELRLEPGDSAQVPVRLTPRTSPERPAGDYEFRIRVAPHSFPDSFADVGGVISIAGVASFDARLTPIQTSGRKEKFKLTLVNTGGLPLSPWLEATDPEGMCTFKFNPPQNLEVGQETVVPIWVGARRNGLVGSTKTLDFRLRVSPAGGASSSARTFDARFVHQPFLGKNMLLYSFLAVLLFSVIGLFFVFGTSSVSRAATVISCGLGDSYQEGGRGQLLIKEECEGAPIPIQKFGSAAQVTPTPGDPSTPAPGQTVAPTAPPDTCRGDPALGLAVDQEVRLRADARIRQEPGLTPQQIGRGEDRLGRITAGPVCVDNLVWWQVDSGVLGWTAEQDENRVRLILTP